MKFNFVLYDLSGKILSQLYLKEYKSVSNALRAAKNIANDDNILIIYLEDVPVKDIISTNKKVGVAAACKRCGKIFVRTTKNKFFCKECYEESHQEKICPVCGKKFKICYQDFTCCSMSCAKKLSTPFKDPEIIKKIAKTNLERYGVENPFNSPEIQKRAILNRDEIKKAESLKETNKIKYKESRRIKELNSGSRSISHKEMILLDKFKSEPGSRTFNVIQSKTFEDCVFKNKLRFDFYIPEFFNKEFNEIIPPVLIEYDGAQHYKPVRFNNIPDSQMYRNFISCQVKDWYKDLYAITNNINFIRIADSRGQNFNDIYKNAYIIGKSQYSDQIFEAFDIIKQDCVNNGKGVTYLIESGIKCTFKCDKESNCQVCHNYALSKNTPKVFYIKDLINDYLSQDLSKSVTFQGLEPLDTLKQHLWFIYHFRKISSDPIYLWTGYNEEECEDLIYLIKKMKWENIIIKFGRFIPNRPHKYDEVLGVELSSDNQYARRI